jgi:hypothetical protein
MAAELVLTRAEPGKPVAFVTVAFVVAPAAAAAVAASRGWSLPAVDRWDSLPAMPRTKSVTDSIAPLLDQFLDGLAERLAARIASHGNQKIPAVARPAAKSPKETAGGRGPRAGKKLDMICRVEGCKDRSKGPRFGFMCAEHGKTLSKAQQAEARSAWNVKHGVKAA